MEMAAVAWKVLGARYEPRMRRQDRWLLSKIVARSSASHWHCLSAKHFRPRRLTLSWRGVRGPRIYFKVAESAGRRVDETTRPLRNPNVES